MQIREKLLDFKKRLSDRHMYSIVIAVIGVIALWGLYQYKEELQFRQRMENQYHRAFFETVGYVQNVETMLAKAMISNSPSQEISTLGEVWRQANLAQANLGQLPISHLAVDNSLKFLTQVSDYAYSLVRQGLNNKPITPKQFDELKKLHDYAEKMTRNLIKLEEALGQGRLKWGELTQRGTSLFQRTGSNFSVSQFENLEKEFKEYPGLIYDGPFSDGLKNIKPKGLTGKMVNQEQAKNIAVAFIGADRVKDIKFVGTSNGTIKTYDFQVALYDAKDASAMVSITQKGGHPLLMTNNRDVTREVLNINQVKDAAQKFLKSRGFTSMVDTYYLKENGVATINYAYKQDNVVVYPDLIKVKIALDNGEILGFECGGYLTSHTKRMLPKPKVSEAQARKVINPKLKIFSSGLAVIPTEWGTEVLTYEFKGKVDNRDFIVYVNANTGKEEKILLIVNTPNGILTM